MTLRSMLGLFLLLHGCLGDIMSIGDNMYPYVALLDPAVPVTWHKKFFAQRLAASQVLSITIIRMELQ
jgi:hypothetical protein